MLIALEAINDLCHDDLEQISTLKALGKPVPIY